MWVNIALATDLAAGAYVVRVNGGGKKCLAVAEKSVGSVERLSLRTGPWRGCSDGAEADVDPDVPVETPAVFRLARVTVRTSG